MTRNALFTAAALLLASHPAVRGGSLLFDNLSQPFYDSVSLDANNWMGQGFSSGSASLLTGVTLNLFTPETGESGGYFVALYREGLGDVPDPLVAVLADNQPISALTQASSAVVTFSGLSQPLIPNSLYYIVVGGDSGASSFLWGYNLSDGGIGAAGADNSSYSGGAWAPPVQIFPQRMQVTGVPDSGGTILAALLAWLGMAAAERLPRSRRPNAALAHVLNGKPERVPMR